MSIKHLTAVRGLCAALILALALSLGGCFIQEEIIDPHIGEVCVSDGAGGEMWVPLYEELPVSDLRAEEFYTDGAYINYSGTQYIAKRGIDVSEHQQSIDWAAVRADGVEFAIIRAGYRGCSAGQLNEDIYFKQNIEGALAQGIEVGIYFFSQALSTEEALEEALYVLDLIDGYSVTLPVFYDWELVTNMGETRCDDLTGEQVTDNALAFCSAIERHGHESGLYFYRTLGYREYDLGRLAGITFWAAAPGSTPDFYYKHSFWQYSFTAEISGIAGATDLDLMFVEKEPASSPLPEGDIAIEPPAVVAAQ